MMEDFFLRALAGGIGVALLSGPFGCFLVWRRMAYFGAALSHSALLGVVLGLALGLTPGVGVLVMCVGLAALLLMLERMRYLAMDTLLGILAHGTLAVGLLLVGLFEQLRLDLMGYLFGDILALNNQDLWWIGGLCVAGLAALAWLWRPLLSATVDADLAAVEGVAVHRVRAVYVLMLAAVIAIGMKVVGILLVVSLLIIPAASARRLSATPERMAVLAALFGVAAVIAGLFGSLQWDLPAGPAVVSAATLLFVLVTLLPLRLLGRRNSRRNSD